MSRMALFWSGTPQQFYSLYEKTARALKSVDPTLKVGGDGNCFPVDDGAYREGFMDYCACAQSAARLLLLAHLCQRLRRSLRRHSPCQRNSQVLDSHGFPNAESILSEWNLSSDFTEREKAELRGAHNAAFIGAVMSYFQDAPSITRTFIAATRHGWGSST